MLVYHNTAAANYVLSTLLLKHSEVMHLSRKLGPHHPLHGCGHRRWGRGIGLPPSTHTHFSSQPLQSVILPKLRGDKGRIFTQIIRLAILSPPPLIGCWLLLCPPPLPSSLNNFLLFLDCCEGYDSKRKWWISCEYIKSSFTVSSKRPHCLLYVNYLQYNECKLMGRSQGRVKWGILVELCDVRARFPLTN